VVEYRSTTNIDNISAVPLHFAACNGHTNAVQLLIEYGADVNIKTSPRNSTSLHFSSEQGHIHIVKILLDNGAHINEISDRVNTPLDLAKNDDVKQLLIAYGGKTSAKLKQLELTQNNPEKDNCVMQ